MGLNELVSKRVPQELNSTRNVPDVLGVSEVKYSDMSYLAKNEAGKVSWNK